MSDVVMSSTLLQTYRCETVTLVSCLLSIYPVSIVYRQKNLLAISFKSGSIQPGGVDDFN